MQNRHNHIACFLLAFAPISVAHAVAAARPTPGRTFTYAATDAVDGRFEGKTVTLPASTTVFVQPYLCVVAASPLASVQGQTAGFSTAENAPATVVDRLYIYHNMDLSFRLESKDPAKIHPIRLARAGRTVACQDLDKVTLRLLPVKGADAPYLVYGPARLYPGVPARAGSVSPAVTGGSTTLELTRSLTVVPGKKQFIHSAVTLTITPL
ncbi:MAG TPA: hypothetical protein VGM37_09100 [Armatimonadota bacterium]|jgi:hypothetical protein